MTDKLVPGQRLKLFHPNNPSFIQFGTFKEYEDGVMIVQFDTFRRSCPLGDWQFEVIPGEIVSHYQVWELSNPPRLVKDNIPNPIVADTWIVQRHEAEHKIASRQDSYLPPAKYEVRAVPMPTDSDSASG